MWPRKQLDIGWADLRFGFAQVSRPGARRPTRGRGGDWMPPEEAIVSLSVRSGWDLLLAALRLPAGQRSDLSAVTIPDMARIIEHHGLVPVPVDVDAGTLEPRVSRLERAITPRTRAIMVAHLFGTRMDMGPIIELARQHDLLVIEDCAQAFVGREYAGHPDSDCSPVQLRPDQNGDRAGRRRRACDGSELRSPDEWSAVAITRCKNGGRICRD